MDDTARNVSQTANHSEELSADARRRTNELRAEIEETRDEIGETVEAIQEKLRPRRIIADATEKVKQATAERVRDMAYSAGQTTRDLASQTRRATDSLMDQARRHPISTALIGLGAAWLFTSRSRSRNRYYDRASARWEDDWTDDSGGGYGLLDRLRDNPIPAALCGVGLTWLATSEARGDDLEGLSEESWDEDTSSGASSTISDAAQRVTETAQQYASETGEALRRTKRRAQSQLQRMMDENPLMVGAGAFVVGAALGLSLPETEREKQLMGEMRDTVVERAQEMARDAASTVQQVTGNAAGEAVKRVIGGDQA